MNRIFTFLAIVFFTVSTFAQSPEGLSYQAVIRNSSNALIKNTQVGMRISFLQRSESGMAVYVETQTPTSNANGLVSVEIGAGTVMSGDFTTIDWANGPYFIKTETDPLGGKSYTITGTSQLLSVPYALYAKTAETVTGRITETDPSFTSSPAANITSTEITNLNNLSGINTGDQDISGIAENATAISEEVARAKTADEANANNIASLKAEQTTQDEAIALNTAKTGITPAQATEITNNTTAITDEVARAKAAEVANADNIAALEAGQATQDEVIALNTAKTGITPAQATAITDNTTAISDEIARAKAAEVANANNITALEEGQATQNQAIALNTAKTGITPVQATAITDNTTAISDEISRAKTAEVANADNIAALEEGQATQDEVIALNTAKTGITPAQATAITNNTSAILTLQNEQTTQNAAIALNTAKIGITPGTVAGQMQYWNGSAWVVVAATANEGAALQMIGGVPTWVGGTPPLAIGDSYQGGIIFWLDATGQHGLIAAPSDQSTGTSWGCYDTTMSGADGTAIGTGNQNTIDIEAGCTAAGTAADICANLTLGGYSDWYLPSRDEIHELYLNKNTVGNFSNGVVTYWSSTEYNSNLAVLYRFDAGYSGNSLKHGNSRVRAIRAF